MGKKVLKYLDIISTTINYIGLVVIIMFFYSDRNYYKFRYMTADMRISKIVGLSLMVIGGCLYWSSVRRGSNVLSLIDFFRINIFAYAIIVSILLYALDLPYLWKYVGYILTVIITEIILFNKSKNNKTA